MKTKDFEPIYIYRAANGVIVGSDRQRALESGGDHVFTNLDEAFEHLRDVIEKKD